MHATTVLSSPPMSTTRLATPRDLPGLTALFEERDGARYEADAVARRLGGLDPARARTLVCERNGAITAMSTLVFREFGTSRDTVRAGYWTDLYVSERARDEGLYLPLTRATLAASTDAGAALTMTANRRRDVYRSHQKLGFRIAAAIPTRARPVRALGAAIDLVSERRLGGIVAPLDQLTFAIVDRLTKRPASSITTEVRALDARTIDELLPAMQRERGRSVGTRVDRAALVARYAMPLEGRPYRAILATLGSELVGAALVRTARRSRFEVTAVLDLLDSGSADVFHTLVHAIEAFARTERTDLVLALDGVADQSSRWDDAGYPATPEWYVVLVAPGARAADPVFGDGSRFRFPFAEHDAF